MINHIHPYTSIYIIYVYIYNVCIYIYAYIYTYIQCKTSQEGSATSNVPSTKRALVLSKNSKGLGLARTWQSIPLGLGAVVLASTFFGGQFVPRKMDIYIIIYIYRDR